MTFGEAYDEETFNRMLVRKEICEHGYLTGECNTELDNELSCNNKNGGN